MKPLALALPALAALLTTAGDGPRFDPAADAVVGMTFTQQRRLEADDLSVVLNGDPVPPEYLPEIELVVEHEGRVVLRDRYLRCADGAPLDLEREYVEVEGEHSESRTMHQPEGDDVLETEARLSSPLEGSRVRFRWDADEEGYDVGYVDQEDGDAALLDGLAARADLRDWLPERELASGASWTVPGERFAALFSPGGDLALLVDGEGEGVVPDEVSYSGEIELRYASDVDVDGRSMARIEVGGSVTVKTTADVSLDSIPVASGRGTNTDEVVHTLEGELLWDLERHCVGGLTLEAQLEGRSRIVAASGTFESEVHLTGEAEYGLVVE